MKRHSVRVGGRCKQCHQQPTRSRHEGRRRNVDLARRQHAQSIGGGMIVRVMFMPGIGVRMMVGLSMRVMSMLVLLMNEPRMLKQGVR